MSVARQAPDSRAQRVYGGVCDSRAQRVERARRLRAQGLTYREIGERMGLARTTVHAYFSDPDFARLRARKASYGGVCEVCGAPTSGNRGPGQARSICQECREWSNEAILDAIRRWAEEHGGIPPTMQEWQAAGVDHPCATTVGNRIGWNEALLRAGFALRTDRRASTQEWIEEQIRAGRPVREIADALGVSVAAIYERLTTRGLRVSDLRAEAAA